MGERGPLLLYEAEQLTQKIHILGFKHKDVVEALYEAAAHAAAWGRIAVERSLVR